MPRTHRPRAILRPSRSATGSVPGRGPIRRKARLVLALSAPLALLAGCGGSESAAAPDASFAVVDSAGVDVVTTTVPEWGPSGSPWSLTVITEIGGLDGDEVYLFGEVADVALVPDGGVAVADRQTADVRFYDAAGEYMRRSGVAGDGPGEFRRIRWLDRCGGGFIAYDPMLRRTTPISLSGVAGEPSPFITGETNRPPYNSTCLPDGSLLAVGWGEAPPRPEGAETWFFTQRANAWRILPDGVIDTIGTYISSERLGMYDPDTGGGGSGPHPFSRSVEFDGDEDHIYIGAGERLQVEVRTLDGELLRIIRGPDTDLDVDAEFMATYRRASLTGMDSVLRAEIVAADDAMPERYPAFSELLVDDLGFVWVERFVLPWDDVRRWGVFAPDGAFLGHLELPLDFELTDVSADRVAGFATDEIGVQRVRVYGLVRGEAD